MAMKECPDSKLILEIVNEAEMKHKMIKARCKRWSCPFCGPINARNLGALLGAVLASYISENSAIGRAFRYTLKIVTLTVPGDDWRLSHTPEQAQELIREALKALLRKLRLHYDLEEYFQVIETKQGWPHVHLLLLGTGIAPPGIMRFINDAWSCLGMGRSEVKMVRSHKGISSYLTKYITKYESKESCHGMHVWSMSRKLRARVVEARKIASINYQVIRVFRKNSDGSCGRMLWEIGSPLNLHQSLESENLGELLDFFDSKKNEGEQLYYWEEAVIFKI